MEVTQVEPGAVTALARGLRRGKYAVQADVDGSPQQGFVVSEITVEPATVTVVGPLRRIKSTDSATTDRVSIEGASINRDGQT